MGQLGEILSQALASHSHLIVDLRPTEFIDSSTISTLVRAKNAAHERDCRFNLLLSTTEVVERALKITGALHTLNRVHSMEEALEPRGPDQRGSTVVLRWFSFPAVGQRRSGAT